jgi:outer membrane immunogenic protein
MKNAVVGIAAIVALIGTPALAADMATKAPTAPAPAPAPVYNWTGFYWGINGGYGFGKTSVNLVPEDVLTTVFTCVGGPCPGAPSFDVNGGFGGLQAGYNWQFATSWVAGLEADFQFSSLKGTGSSAFGLEGPATYFAQQEIDEFGTARARLGWLPINNVLLYATGGFAYGRVKDTVSITAAGSNMGGGFEYFCGSDGTEVPNCFLGSNSRWETGWTAGAGLEFAPWEHVTFRVEYLFVDLGNGGNVNVVAQSVGGGSATPASFTSAFGRTDFNMVRAGVNWIFN